jgi:serine/threonine protein phosphatase 1
MNKGRTIAVGDIHGHALALAGLLQMIKLQPTDTLVTLGDYIDRGPDSKGVLDQLIELEGRCKLVPLMGNHEEMMLGAKEGRDNFKFWMQFGGDVALDSYGPGRSMGLIPWEHWSFLKRLRLFYETDRHFFIHANYFPNRPIQEQDSQTGLWRSLEQSDLPGKHYSGKTAVLGHTQQNNGEILDLDHLVCIDTGCGHGGLLTALDVNSGRIWQVDEKGGVHNG